MAGRLSDLGEFGLIDRIDRLVVRAARGHAQRGVRLGIGDDAAVLRARPDEDVVVSTDAAVEGVHFRWSEDDPRSLGRRAFAAALSDLAAMGARPLGCTLSLAAPAELELTLLDPALAGLVAEAAKRACPLVGGNVSRARETSFHVTVLGAVKRGCALQRCGAKPGDVLFVTGPLGRAALARARAAASGRLNRDVPPDRMSVGRALAALVGTGVRVTCIDLSDGLAADLPHLLEAEGLGAEIEVAALPRPRRLAATCRGLGLEPESLLTGGGEDYELLFSLPADWGDAERVSRRVRAPVRAIGRVVGGGGSARLRPGGWRHF